MKKKKFCNWMPFLSAALHSVDYVSKNQPSSPGHGDDFPSSSTPNKQQIVPGVSQLPLWLVAWSLEAAAEGSPLPTFY